MNECNEKDTFALPCIYMTYVISYAMPSVWYIWIFVVLITISTIWFSFTTLFYRCDKPSKASQRIDLLLAWNVEIQWISMFSRCLNVYGVEYKLNILVSLWTMVLLDWHLIHLRLFAIDMYQRLRNILSLLYNLCLW